MIRSLDSKLSVSFAAMSCLLLISCGDEKAAAVDATKSEAPHEEPTAERVTISEEAAKTSGILLAAAGPGAIEETLELTGRIMLQPAARAEIHAPYPGPVRAVQHNVGDIVRRGETLARVESAESLQTYAVVSPIAGVILDRQTNLGDVTSDTPLFVVGDLSRLQAELNVATRDVGRVSAGQTVSVGALDDGTRSRAKIVSVLPTTDAHSQTLIARAPLPPKDGYPFRPGMAVRGAVVLAQKQVAISVPADTVQSFEGKDVVFVRVTPNTYEARAVTIGQRGDLNVEITAGLAAGEQYVAKNAFLMKAEIGKSAAAHDD